MQLIKRITKGKQQTILARCEKCGNDLEVSYANTSNPHMSSIDLKEVVQCECGEYHNLIVEHTRSRTESYEDNSPIKCPRCESTQLHAETKGFGLGKALTGGILLGPVGLIGGFIKHKKLFITCLKCGFKWPAGT